MGVSITVSNSGWYGIAVLGSILALGNKTRLSVENQSLGAPEGE